MAKTSLIPLHIIMGRYTYRWPHPLSNDRTCIQANCIIGNETSVARNNCCNCHRFVRTRFGMVAVFCSRNFTHIRTFQLIKKFYDFFVFIFSVLISNVKVAKVVILILVKLDKNAGRERYHPFTQKKKTNIKTKRNEKEENLKPKR